MLACAALGWNCKRQITDKYGSYQGDEVILRQALVQDTRELLESMQLNDLAAAIQDYQPKEEEPTSRKSAVSQQKPTQKWRTQPSPNGSASLPLFTDLTGAGRGRPPKDAQEEKFRPPGRRSEMLRKIPGITTEQFEEAKRWNREQLIAALPYLFARRQALVNLFDSSLESAMPAHIIRVVMFIDAATKGELGLFHPSLSYQGRDVGYGDVEEAVKSCLRLYFDNSNPKARSLGELFGKWVNELHRREQEKHAAKR